MPNTLSAAIYFFNMRAPMRIYWALMSRLHTELRF